MESSNPSLGARNPKQLTKYSAKWCGPCKNMAPMVKKLCEERSIMLIEVDVDDLSDEQKKELGLKSVPTFLLLNRSSGMSATKIGSCSEQHFKDFLDQPL